MRITRRWLATMAAALMISSVPVTSFGAVLTYEDMRDALEAMEKGKTEEKTGPGYTFLKEDEEKAKEEFVGPSVKKITLTERHHADYELYEESMADLFFLYSNVGNGGVTHESVYIDIPANVMYTMEKDGVPFAYASRRRISARGTYVLRLTAVENLELPLSEQTEYQSTFRFRIQDELPISEQEKLAKEKAEALKDAEASTGSSGEVIIFPTDGSEINLETVTENAKEAVKDAAKDAAKEVVDSAVDSAKDKVQEGVGQLTDKAGEALEQVTDKIDEAKEQLKENLVPRTQEYEPINRRYIVTLENGLEVVSTVPEGYVGPSAVELRVAEGVASRAKLYCNDQEIEFVNGNSQLEPGSYRLVLDGYAYSFTIAHSISAMDVYPAPAGMHFTEVLLDGEAVNLTSDQNISMKEDGSYTIFMEDEDGNELEVALLKDTTAPEVVVTVKGGNAAIQYVSDDIVSVSLERNGEVIEGFGGTMISEPGNYRLTAADEAGNTSEVNFVLTYQVNMYGILAVLLVIAVVVALVMFVLHTKKNMKVR